MQLKNSTHLLGLAFSGVTTAIRSGSTYIVLAIAVIAFGEEGARLFGLYSASYVVAFVICDFGSQVRVSDDLLITFEEV